MDIVDKGLKIVEQPVCNHCLGRQFAQLLHGMSNRERGEIIRKCIAMAIDQEKATENIDMSNFVNFKFHNLALPKAKRQKCSVCQELFQDLNKWKKRIDKKLGKYEINTFLVGTVLSNQLLMEEENLWERVGIDWCEPLKAEINREIGKLIEKEHDLKRPQAMIIINLSENKVEIKLNPVFIYGEYQKHARGIPQTKWPSGKYKTSVEQIIAAPFMKKMKGSGHKFHGAGREDIDAKCLGWRPFVLEISEPKTRTVKLREIQHVINKGKKVKVRKLSYSSPNKVRKIKASAPDKTYQIIVKSREKLGKKELSIVKKLKGAKISQKTPHRVLHRRADTLRKRKIKDIKAKYKNSKTFELIVTTEAGLYIKELVTGDKGRTTPNISALLGKECWGEKLDVIKVM